VVHRTEYDHEHQEPYERSRHCEHAPTTHPYPLQIRTWVPHPTHSLNHDRHVVPTTLRSPPPAWLHVFPGCVVQPLAPHPLVSYPGVPLLAVCVIVPCAPLPYVIASVPVSARALVAHLLSLSVLPTHCL